MKQDFLTVAGNGSCVEKANMLLMHLPEFAHIGRRYNVYLVKSVFRIRDVLIRIPINGCAPLDYGSSSLLFSSVALKMPIKIKNSAVFWFITYRRYITSVFQLRRKQTGEIKGKKYSFFMGGSRYVQTIIDPGPEGPQFNGFGTLHVKGTVSSKVFIQDWICTTELLWVLLFSSRGVQEPDKSRWFFFIFLLIALCTYGTFTAVFKENKSFKS
jgi:hypothetical protein